MRCVIPNAYRNSWARVMVYGPEEGARVVEGKNLAVKHAKEMFHRLVTVAF